jgi:hypothetical protein
LIWFPPWGGPWFSDKNPSIQVEAEGPLLSGKLARACLGKNLHARPEKTFYYNNRKIKGIAIPSSGGSGIPLFLGQDCRICESCFPGCLTSKGGRMSAAGLGLFPFSHKSALTKRKFLTPRFFLTIIKVFSYKRLGEPLRYIREKP